MRLFCLLVAVSVVTLAHAAGDHAYLKKGYNKTTSDPVEAMSKLLQAAFPKAYNRKPSSFHGHYKAIAGYPEAIITVLPDLDDGISTRGSTIQYIDRTLEYMGAVLFVNDPINPSARSVSSPQSFSCKKAIYRAPRGISYEDFKSAFYTKMGENLQIDNQIKNFDENACQCFRLGLEKPSPAEIKKYIDMIASRDLPSRKYFVVMEQRQMPGEQGVKYTVDDWNEAFGITGYQMLIDLYAQTALE